MKWSSAYLVPPMPALTMHQSASETEGKNLPLVSFFSMQKGAKGGRTNVLELERLLQGLGVASLERLDRRVIELHDRLGDDVSSAGDTAGLTGHEGGEEVVGEAGEDLEGGVAGEVLRGLGVRG